MTARKASDETVHNDGDVLSTQMFSAPVGTGVEYASDTGAVTIQTDGLYLFSWSLLLRNENEADTNVVVALEDSAGADQYALSGAHTVTGNPDAVIVGTALLDARAGDTFVLRNRSGHAVRFNAASGASAGIAGNLTAMRVS